MEPDFKKSPSDWGIDRVTSLGTYLRRVLPSPSLVGRVTGEVSGRILWIEGVARPGGSKKGFNIGGRVRIVDASKHVGAWKRTCSDQASSQWDGEPLDGALHVVMGFFLTRPQNHYGSGSRRNHIKPGARPHPSVIPDLTKLIRSTEDALTGIVWNDDGQITSRCAFKRYLDERSSSGERLVGPIEEPGVLVITWRLEDL